MNPQVIFTLDRARAKLKQGWTKGWHARNANGDPVTVTHPKACRWCLSGAVCAALGPVCHETCQEIEKTLELEGRGNSIEAFNDHPDTKLATVLGVIDRTKKRLSLEVGS